MLFIFSLVVENILETAKKILEAVEKIEPLLCQHQEGDECEVS